MLKNRIRQGFPPFGNKWASGAWFSIAKRSVLPVKTGVPTDTIIRPRTRKEKEDRRKGREAAWKKTRKLLQSFGNLYKCSNCANTVRLENIGDRKILCTKCNVGIFVKQKESKKKNKRSKRK